MGLLLSVLVTCVGVLEVIACFTHFRVGIAYNECKSNIRDIAKYYAIELRKHDLQFEPGPGNGSNANEETSHAESLSELIRTRSSVHVQEKPEHWGNGYTPGDDQNTDLLQPSSSCSHTPGSSTPSQTIHLIAPRNSVCGVDTPTLQQLSAANINIPEVVADTIQEHVNDEQFWTRKPATIFDKSRSPSPFPKSNSSDTGTELIYTPNLRYHRSLSPRMPAEVPTENERTAPSENELVENDFWNKGPAISVQSDISESFSDTDLEVKRITESVIIVTDIDEPVIVSRQASPYPETLFGITDDTEETKFDEAFLRSLDGVKSPKCDDRRRSFKKKRNSSSNSSRASRDRSLTSLDEMDVDSVKKPIIDHQIDKHETKESKISPLTEEDTEMKDDGFANNVANELMGHEVRTETVVPEKYDTLENLSQTQSVDENKDVVTVSKQENTLFEASVIPNTSKQDASKEKPDTNSDKGKANLTFTEKVKDLEISVQLLVTVKGTSKGDKMEYVTSVTQDDQKPKESPGPTTAIERPKNEESVTKTTKECSEFGKVKTSVTYGNKNISTPEQTANITDTVQGTASLGKDILEKPDENETKQNLKELQISSQSLIHAERTVQDVNSSEAEFLKLYESFTELPNGQKDKFLRIIGQSSKVNENNSDENQTLATNVENIENIQKQIQLNESEKPVCSKETNENEEVPMNKEILEISDSKIVTEEDAKLTVSTLNQNELETQNQQNVLSENVDSSHDSHIVPTNKTISNSSKETKDTKSTVEKICDISEKNTFFVPSKEVSITALIEPAAEDDTNVKNVELSEPHISAQTSKNAKSLISTDMVKNVDETKRTIEIDEISIEESKETKEESDTKQEIKKYIKNENRSDSPSETPSSAVESSYRRASKTAFEEANIVQNREMMTRRLSNSEISPKQATQAFWLIFSAEYTNAMEKDWHGQHFSCWQCDESLTGQRYVLRDEHPYCVKCYEQVFANTCEKCNRIIGIDSKDLSYKEKHWHEACFQCTTCSESLVDKQFGAKGEKIYCGNCYDKQFASRCDGCSKIFHAGTKKMEYKNRQWHEQCFKCCKCETPIGTKSFIPREKDIYCAGCYEEKFATRCVKCNKAIQSGGVTYKNEPWHRECFTCTHCNKNLAGQRFTSRDDKPCCADCFGKLFAKRCTACTEPITGIGGTRFISFEDRHWHNDCFICASCTTSLVGRGFITDEDKIICPECAKERFM